MGDDVVWYGHQPSAKNRLTAEGELSLQDQVKRLTEVYQANARELTEALKENKKLQEKNNEQRDAINSLTKLAILLLEESGATQA